MNQFQSLTLAIQSCDPAPNPIEQGWGAMPNFDIIITDVTTYGDLYCVAGWDIQQNIMVRPEPAEANAGHEPSRFWNNQWAGPGKFFDVGNIVHFEAALPPQNFPLPHATEDRIWIRPTHQTPSKTLNTAQIAAAVPVSTDISSAFGGGLIHAASGKAYVPRDFDGPSLGGIIVSSENLTLFENTFDPKKPKLRANLIEDGTSYDLAVTADAARTRWLGADLKALQADIRSCNQIHVRVGLSRPFPGRPDECYAQINGLYPI